MGIVHHRLADFVGSACEAIGLGNAEFMYKISIFIPISFVFHYCLLEAKSYVLLMTVGRHDLS